MLRVAIFGASGYAGNELIRIGLGHGGMEFVALNSENHVGEEVRSMVPGAPAGLRFTNRSIAEINDDRCDVVFLATPHGFAKEAAPRLKARVIDLSADFRDDPVVPYGLPELFRDKLKNARLVANPGCYATAAILSAWPLVKAGLAGPLIFDGKSGYSGAGRAPTYVNDPAHFTDNVLGYALTDHRHRAEIARALGRPVSFTPHVIPTFRGILMTTHCLMTREGVASATRSNEGSVGARRGSDGQVGARRGSGAEDSASLRQMFEDSYRAELFVRLMTDRAPELHDVQGTNLCAIGGFEVDDLGRAVVIATIDNLVKGAAGQAIQNMNIMCGEPEGRGLTPLTPLPAGRRGP